MPTNPTTDSQSLNCLDLHLLQSIPDYAYATQTEMQYERPVTKRGNCAAECAKRLN